MKIRCPHCHNAIEMLQDSEFKDMSCESCGSHFNLVEDPDAKTLVSKIQTIDHFTLLGEVGTGACCSKNSAQTEYDGGRSRTVST
jgi:hypothetical protein